MFSLPHTKLACLNCWWYAQLYVKLRLSPGIYKLLFSILTVVLAPHSNSGQCGLVWSCKWVALIPQLVAPVRPHSRTVISGLIPTLLCPVSFPHWYVRSHSHTVMSGLIPTLLCPVSFPHWYVRYHSHTGMSDITPTLVSCRDHFQLW